MRRGVGRLASALAVTVALAGSVCAAPAGPERAGLLWNHSGLPATLPLQVKTAPGRDHILTLVDVESGDEVLAARIIGGEFFRVLVPPGTFTLRFTSDGSVTELAEPLTFAALGAGTKAGHMVDLREAGADVTGPVRVVPQAICQTLETGYEPAWQARQARELEFLELPGLDGRHPGYVDGEAFDLNAYHRYWDHALSYPRYQLRSRICD